MISKQMAEAVARSLREFGYPDITADQVLEQVALPPDKRSIVGLFAVQILADNGIQIAGAPEKE